MHNGNHQKNQSIKQMKVDVTTWCSENSLAGKYLADEICHICDDKLPEKVFPPIQKVLNNYNSKQIFGE